MNTYIYALIKDGVVVNAIVTNDNDNPATFPDRFGIDLAVDITESSPRPGPGWLYDGTTFTAPEQGE